MNGTGAAWGFVARWDEMVSGRVLLVVAGNDVVLNFMVVASLS